MDGLLVPSRKPLERHLGEVEDGLVSGDSSVEERERPELDDLGRVVGRRLEAQSVNEGPEKGETKLVDGLGDGLFLLPPDGGDVGEELRKEGASNESERGERLSER